MRQSSLSRRHVLAGAAIAALALAGAGQALAADQDHDAVAQSMMRDMVLGNPDAPVTIIEYASLTCPHCATFHKEVLPDLKREYIDTGKVRLIYRDFPFDRFALSAAMLARCSGPERYFGFLDILFRQQQSWVGGGEAQEVIGNLTRLARLSGMDDAKVQACLENEELADYILNERLTGNRDYGVESTPTLRIDGRNYAGVRRMDELRGIIEPLLPAEMRESRLPSHRNLPARTTG